MHTARSGDRNSVGGDRAILDRRIGYLRRGDRFTLDRWLGPQGGGPGSGVVTPSLWDSYSESNADTAASLYSGNFVAVGQSFTAAGRTLSKALFYMRSALSTETGNIYANVYALTGSFGSTSVPVGAVLYGSNPVDITTIESSTPMLVTFTFPSAVGLTPGANYGITVDVTSTNVTPSNGVVLMYDSSAPTHPGNLFYSGPTSASGWTPVSTADLCFYVYGLP